MASLGVRVTLSRYLRERARVRVSCEISKKSPHPNPLPEYRARERDCGIHSIGWSS
jgi:hypothetical protein